MLGHSLEERKLIIANRIVREVDRFNRQRSEGMPMSGLSCKYAKALVELGGFPELMDQLARLGILRFEVLPTGARLVFALKNVDTSLEQTKIDQHWY